MSQNQLRPDSLRRARIVVEELADGSVAIATKPVGNNGASLIDADSGGLKVAIVSGAAGGGGDGGGLTDDELRASPVPVSGSVSVSNFPSSQAVTGTFWQATQPVSGSVSVSNFPATQPVSGTFWQATQPVSGPLTDAQLRAAAVPVSGTFWQATQPISAASLPLPSGASTETTLAAIKAKTDNLDVALSTRAVTGLTDSQLRASGNGTASTALRVTVASDSTGTVAITPPTLTKGAQGSTGLSVQPLRDAGRTLCAFTATALATVTSEALISLTPYRDLTAGSAATTFAVTSNKKLRLQALILTIRCTSTVNVGGIVRFRMLAGTVLVGSPVHFAVGGQGSNLATAVAGNAQTYFIDLPEGFELSGSMQFGLTQLFSATSATIDVSVLGYEY